MPEKGGPGSGDIGAGHAPGPLPAFLRDLARARRAPTRDLASYARVHWLADLPPDVYVETEAGPGDVLFSVPIIPMAPPAERAEFDAWLALRHWYRALRDLAAVRGDEVVLATGLLTRGPVRDHLLTTPVRIVVDERSERVDVLLAGPSGLRDGELLDGAEGYSAERTAALREDVAGGRGLGLDASVAEVLRAWSALAFTGETIDFSEGWTPEHASAASGAAARLWLAPALVVRPPGRAAVAAYFEEIGAQPHVPPAFAALLDPDAPSPVQFTTTPSTAALAPRPPAPRAQDPSSGRFTPDAHDPDAADAGAARRAGWASGDGPAGTAALVARLLGEGERVLAVTADAAAAGRLHGALPPEIAELCALPGTSALVAEAVRARTARTDAAADRHRADDLARRTALAAQRAAELRDRLDRARADDGPAGPSWLPARPGLPPAPPISAPEAAELVRLLTDQGPDRTGHRDVDPATLPSAPYVRTLIEAEAAAADRVDGADTEVSAALRSCDPAVLTRLDESAAPVNAALRDLGMTGHPAGWKHTDPTVRAFTDLLARRRPAVWEQVAELTGRVEEAAALLENIAGRHIELPPGDPPLRLLASDARELRTQLVENLGRRGPRKPLRQAGALLRTCLVDGEPALTPARLDALHVHVTVLLTCRELQAVWEEAGVSFPADVPLPERVARFRRAHQRLTRVRSIAGDVEETTRMLAALRLPIPITHPVQWYGYTAGLEHVLLGQGIDRAAADLAALRDSIPVTRRDPPELADARAAIDARDAAAYGRALHALADARHRRAAQLRRDELMRRVQSVHPELAEMLYDAGDDWPDRIATWDEAWKRAAEPGARRGGRPPVEGLERDAAQAADRHRALDAELTAARARAAWGDGPGTIPAWIVPLWQVPDVLPPGPDAFDVVIVDGEHGAGAEALFLLWLAPRVILVGEPGPPLPPPERAPAPLPPPLGDVVTPTATLFTLLAARFAASPAEPEPDPVPEGRSIVTYKRPELLALVAQLAAEDRAADDDTLIARARAELACPPGEDSLVEARLRFAVDAYRASVT
ncbi:hypothetical protein [Actinomadura flavalba]|uniref:hypothetical protein n=1 Tax=Actinomadura flavalba TaxID=1120938 RepID=UPI0003828D85|nr:hypothetical protein [Actinomadura flavalba]